MHWWMFITGSDILKYIQFKSGIFYGNNSATLRLAIVFLQQQRSKSFKSLWSWLYKTSRPPSSKMKMFIMSHSVRMGDILFSMRWKSYGTFHHVYVTYTLLHYEKALCSGTIWRYSSLSKGAARCTGTRNMTAFLIKQR